MTVATQTPHRDIASRTRAKRAASTTNRPIVDLTISDSDDDAPTLASKRRISRAQEPLSPDKHERGQTALSRAEDMESQSTVPTPRTSIGDGRVRPSRHSRSSITGPSKKRKQDAYPPAEIPLHLKRKKTNAQEEPYSSKPAHSRFLGGGAKKIQQPPPSPSPVRSDIVSTALKRHVPNSGSKRAGGEAKEPMELSQPLSLEEELAQTKADNSKLREEVKDLKTKALIAEAKKLKVEDTLTVATRRLVALQKASPDTKQSTKELEDVKNKLDKLRGQFTGPAGQNTGSLSAKTKQEVDEMEKKLWSNDLMLKSSAKLKNEYLQSINSLTRERDELAETRQTLVAKHSEELRNLRSDLEGKLKTQKENMANSHARAMQRETDTRDEKISSLTEQLHNLDCQGALYRTDIRKMRSQLEEAEQTSTTARLNAEEAFERELRIKQNALDSAKKALQASQRTMAATSQKLELQQSQTQKVEELLAGEREARKTESQESQAQQETIKKELQESQQRKEDLTLQLKDEVQRKGVLESKLLTMQPLVDGLALKTSALEEMKRDLQDDNNKLKKLQDARDNEIKLLEDKINTAKSHYEEEIRQSLNLSIKLKEIHASREKATNRELSELRAKVEGMASLQATKEELAQQNRGLETLVSSLKAKIKGNDKDLETNTQALEESRRNHEFAMNELVGGKTGLEQRVSELEAVIKDHNDTVSVELHGEVAALKQELAATNEKLTTVEKELAALKQELRRSERHVAYWKDEYDDLYPFYASARKTVLDLAATYGAYALEPSNGGQTQYRLPSPRPDAS